MENNIDIEIVIDDYYEKYRQAVIVDKETLMDLEVDHTILFNEDSSQVVKSNVDIQEVEDYNVLRVSWISEENDKMRLFLANGVFDEDLVGDKEWMDALKTIFEVDFITNTVRRLKPRPLNLQLN